MAEEERPERCETCRFWAKDSTAKQDKLGQRFCLRYPPQLVVFEVSNGEQEACDVWPETSASDWCGEWQPSALNVKAKPPVSPPPVPPPAYPPPVRKRW